MVAGHFGKELPAQCDHVRQVQIVPFHPSVIHAGEAGVESASNVDYKPVGVFYQKGPRVAVELAHAQDRRHQVEQLSPELEKS